MKMITDADYLRYDPFEGDRDVDIRCRTVKLVKVRKPQKCHGLGRETHGHQIKVGERARYETAIVDGEWGRLYCCLGCMNKWLTEACGMTLAPASAAVEFKTISAHWSHFLERDIPTDAPDVQVSEMKRAFAAGAISGLQLCLIEHRDKSGDERRDALSAHVADIKNLCRRVTGKMKPDFVSLKALPISHELRNRPLAAIGARYSNVHGNGRWNTVTPAYGIAKSTYNDLAQSWKENNLWQAPLP